MLQTKKVGKELCAVAFNPTEIMVRSSGKQFFGKEKTLARLSEDGFVVDEDVAKEYGVSIYIAGNGVSYDYIKPVKRKEEEQQ